MTCPDQDARSRTPRVAVVGGGPGGLFAAWHLERLAASPLQVTILEASDRLGGKVCSPRFATAPVRYEAGAAELYDYSPVDDDPLRALVRELGLATVPLTGAGVHLGGRLLANLDDVGVALGPAARDRWTSFDTWARSAMTPREFYEAGSDHAAAAVPHARFDAVLAGDDPAADFVATMIHSDLATEPAATTAAYGLQNYLMNDPAYLRLYRIAGGNEQLVAALASRLAATIRLDSPVTHVAAVPGGPVTVTSRSAGGLRHDEFDIVILALPLGPLAGIRFADDALAAGLRRHVAHHDHPAHYLRITFLCDRPVAGVPGGDDFLMLDAFGGTCLYIESSRDPVARHGVMGLLLGGQAASDMACLDDQALVAAGLAALPEPFAAYRAHVVEARVHRWAGAVSAVPGGWQPLPVDRRHRPSPDHPQVMVVGDYLYDSTLNGVFDSAQHVAGWVAADLAAADAATPDPTPKRDV